METRAKFFAIFSVKTLDPADFLRRLGAISRLDGWRETPPALRAVRKIGVIDPSWARVNQAGDSEPSPPDEGSMSGLLGQVNRMPRESTISSRSWSGE
jgi:hypothetical protein